MIATADPTGRSDERRTPALPVATPEELGFSPARLSRLSEILKAEIARGTIPGAVIMIGRHGKVAFCEALGVQDPSTGAPMRVDSVFRIFSMTKPITSVAAMMLIENGALRLDEPLSKFIPAFAKVKVARVRHGTMELVEPRREITIHDLLRHTSGLSHEIIPTPLQSRYAEVRLARRDRSNADHAELIAELPLLCHPGSEWNYSRSVEVLGRVIEIVSRTSLGSFLRQHIFEPLQMQDTGFFVSQSRAEGRVAQPFAHDPWTRAPVALFPVFEEPRFEAGGGGLVSTAPDYARFAEMLLNGGSLDGARILSSRTVRFMTVDHLDPCVTAAPDPLPPGFGFGLGVAVRTRAGLSPFPGSVGQYFWNGTAGTQYWADPAEGLWSILMVQAPGQREHLRVLIRTLVYAALDD